MPWQKELGVSKPALYTQYEGQLANGNAKVILDKDVLPQAAMISLENTTDPSLVRLPVRRRLLS